MIFGFPAAIYFAALAIPIAVIFLYRRHLRELEVPAVQIWVSLGRPVQVNSFRSILRRILALLVQLLLLMLLIVALADPSPQRSAAQRLIIVIDVSATMQTHEGQGIERIEMARQASLAALDSASRDTEVVVLLAAQTPTLSLAPTRDRAIAKTVITATESLDVDGDLFRTLIAAAAFAPADKRTRTVVVSDFAGESLDALRAKWKSHSELEFIPVGSDRANAAITDLWIEPAATATRCTATIAQKGMAGRTVPVRFSIEGQPVASTPVTLRNDPLEVSFTAEISPGATYAIEMDSGDALAVDDRAVGVHPRHSRASVCLVTRGNPDLLRALEANSNARLRVVSHDQYAGPRGDSVVIVDGPGLAPMSPNREVGYLFIGTVDPFGLSRSRRWASMPSITHWASEHPALADIDPSVLSIPKALIIEGLQGTQFREILAADYNNIIVEIAPSVSPSSSVTTQPVSVMPRRCIYWLFDLTQTDLSRRIAFPVLLWNCIEYLASDNGEETEYLRTGTTVRRGLRRWPTGSRMLDPKGQTVAAEIVGSQVLFPLVHQGIYVQRPPSDEQRLAANLLSSRGVVPLVRAGIAAPVSPSLAVNINGFRRVIFNRPTWQIALLAAMAVGLLEWFLFHRGWLRLG
jgi:hypothetical protein